jgi:hypothetical protein
MLGAQTRNQRTIVIFVGVLIFLSIFVGLVYNHLDSIQLPSRYVRFVQRDMRLFLASTPAFFPVISFKPGNRVG